MPLLITRNERQIQERKQGVLCRQMFEAGRSVLGVAPCHPKSVEEIAMTSSTLRTMVEKTSFVTCPGVFDLVSCQAGRSHQSRRALHDRLRRRSILPRTARCLTGDVLTDARSRAGYRPNRAQAADRRWRYRLRWFAQRSSYGPRPTRKLGPQRSSLKISRAP